MKIHEMEFRGFYEDAEAETGQTLQLLTPEDRREQDLLSWALLAAPHVIKEDSAREQYTFEYRPGSYLADGLFSLKIVCRDASDHLSAAEIATGLVVTTSQVSEHRDAEFVPMWFLRDDLVLSTSD